MLIESTHRQTSTLNTLFVHRFLVATEARSIPLESKSNDSELPNTTNSCDNVDQGESINGCDKRKCSELEEQEPKRKKYDKKNRGQNKVEYEFISKFYRCTFIQLGDRRLLSLTISIILIFCLV